MPRPSLGPRRAVSLRLPVPLAERITKLGISDRHAWIVGAVERRLESEENGK